MTVGSVRCAANPHSLGNYGDDIGSNPETKRSGAVDLVESFGMILATIPQCAGYLKGWIYFHSNIA
jgi:hypothetical protein